MKQLVLILLTILTIKGNAQEVFGMTDWEVQLMEYVPIRYYPDTKVNKITFVKMNKKQEVVDTYVKEYNSAGKLTSYVSMDKKNSVISKVDLRYNDADHLTQMDRTKKGKLKRKVLFAYTDDEKPLSHMKYNGSSKLIQKETWAYNEEGCLQEYIWFKSGGEKIKKRWVHEYRENCEKSKSTLFNGKGKLMNVWTYDCKQEGEKLVKKKNETQVCRWEEIGPETITKVYQSFDEKGRIVKNVSKYTAGDTLILEWARYDENDQLMHKSTYDKDPKKLLRSTSYRKNGKEWYDTQRTYEDDKIVSNVRSKKGKVYGKTVYTYNEQGLLSEYVSTRGNGNVYNAYNMSYD